MEECGIDLKSVQGIVRRFKIRSDLVKLSLPITPAANQRALVISAWVWNDFAPLSALFRCKTTSRYRFIIS